MNFLFPAMLAGLAGMAIPIALHLIAKHRFPVQDFPSIRLLRKDLRTNVFAPRLVDVPQLLLRLLVLALLVAAMARLFSSSGTGGDAPRNLVVIIDGSAGMRMQILDDTTKTKTSLFTLAKKEAQSLLEQLNPSSQCAVLFAGEKSSVAAPLQHGKETALQSLQALEPVDGSGCGLVKAVADGCTLVAGRREVASQIVVLTDMRANAFASQNQRDIKQIEQIRQSMGPALKIIFVDLAEQKELNNLAIVNAQIRGDNARVGDDAHVITRVFNSGTKPKNARLSLQVGDRKEPAVKDIPLEPGAEAVVDLTARVQRAANTVATARIAEDDLTFDDSFSVPLNISDTRRILLINGGSQSTGETKPSDLVKLGATPTNAGADEDGKLDGATILRFVLNPGRELGGANGTGIETTMITPEALSSQTLSKYDLIVMYDVSSLPDAALEDITTYVNEGRSLLLVCAGNTQALNFNRVLASGTAKRPALSPAQLGNDKALDQPVEIQLAGNAHALLTPFQDRLKGDLSIIRFTKLREVQSLAENTASILTAQSGMPLALEHAVGRGKVMLLTFGFELDRGNIARARVFPAFIWRLTDYLTGRLRQRVPDVVQALTPAVLDVSEPAFSFVNEVELNPEKKPQESGDKSVATAIKMACSTDKTALMPALSSGRYLLTKATTGQETVRVGYARYVTTFIDPAESDTRREAEANLPALLSGDTAVIAVKDAQSLSLSGSELWRPLVLFLAFAYLAEALLGYVLTKRKEKQRMEEATA